MGGEGEGQRVVLTHDSCCMRHVRIGHSDDHIASCREDDVST